jgi:hypothetical protein
MEITNYAYLIFCRSEQNLSFSLYKGPFLNKKLSIQYGLRGLLETGRCRHKNCNFYVKFLKGTVSRDRGQDEPIEQ